MPQMLSPRHALQPFECTGHTASRRVYGRDQIAGQEGVLVLPGGHWRVVYVFVAMNILSPRNNP
jgi:hypothetical protein